MSRPPKTISVIERRLQGPSLFHTGSQSIPLKEPQQWRLYWENSAIRPDQLYDTIHRKGWQYVEAADLDCPIEEIGATVRDGKIVRGTRGEEVLLKMDVNDYKKLEQAKDRETRKQTFGRQQLKKAIVDGVATEHGARAAEFMQQEVNVVTVQDTRGPEDGT